MRFYSFSSGLLRCLRNKGRENKAAHGSLTKEAGALGARLR